jgi:hypothetical protein
MLFLQPSFTHITNKQTQVHITAGNIFVLSSAHSQTAKRPRSALRLILNATPELAIPVPTFSHPTALPALIKAVPKSSIVKTIGKGIANLTSKNCAKMFGSHDFPAIRKKKNLISAKLLFGYLFRPSSLLESRLPLLAIILFSISSSGSIQQVV